MASSFFDSVVLFTYPFNFLFYQAIASYKCVYKEEICIMQSRYFGNVIMLAVYVDILSILAELLSIPHKDDTVNSEIFKSIKLQVLSCLYALCYKSKENCK